MDCEGGVNDDNNFIMISSIIDNNFILDFFNHRLTCSINPETAVVILTMYSSCTVERTNWFKSLFSFHLGCG